MDELKRYDIEGALGGGLTTSFYAYAKRSGACDDGEYCYAEEALAIIAILKAEIIVLKSQVVALEDEVYALQDKVE